MNDPRIIPCTHCGSEGRILGSRHGGNDPDTIDHGPCPACEGTGGEIIETEMIEMEDLP